MEINVGFAGYEVALSALPKVLLSLPDLDIYSLAMSTTRISQQQGRVHTSGIFLPELKPLSVIEE